MSISDVEAHTSDGAAPDDDAVAAERDASEHGAAEHGGTEQKSPRRRFRWVLDLAIFAAVIVGVGMWQSRNLVPSGEVAPALALAQLDGPAVDLSELRGKAVQVQFWATWCSVCRREFGALNRLHADAGDDRVVLTVVEDHDDLDALRTFVADRELTYPILLADTETLRAWNVSAFPTTYWIAPDGTVSARRVGAVTRWGMAWRLRQALR